MNFARSSHTRRPSGFVRWELAAAIGGVLVIGGAWILTQHGRGVRHPTLQADHSALSRVASSPIQEGAQNPDSAKSIDARDYKLIECARALGESFNGEEVETETWKPSEELQQRLGEVSRADARAALDLVATLSPDRFVRHTLATLVARTWGEVDPSAAWRWAKTESQAWDLEGRAALFTAVLEGMARSEPRAVVACATEALLDRAGEAELDPGAVSLHAVHALLQAGQTSLVSETVSQWSQKVSLERLRPEIITVAVHALAQRSPEEAWNWLRTIPPAAISPEAIAMLATRWAENSPADALTWATNLPAGVARENAIERGFQVWSSNDEAAAIRWLSGHTAAAPSDRLLMRLLERPAFRNEYAEAAVQLAELIRDDALRGPALQSAVLAWGNRDRASATHYAETAPQLTTEQRTRLLLSLQHYAQFGFY